MLYNSLLKYIISDDINPREIRTWIRWLCLRCLEHNQIDYFVMNLVYLINDSQTEEDYGRLQTRMWNFMPDIRSLTNKLLSRMSRKRVLDAMIEFVPAALSMYDKYKR